MPRKRQGDIVESSEELLRLEKQYRGKPEAARVKVLRLLKEDPSLAIDEAAVVVGYSKQAVKRWLKVYREDGLSSLLHPVGRRRETQHDGQIVLLQRRLESGEFADLQEVARWIHSLLDREPDRVRLTGPASKAANSSKRNDDGATEFRVIPKNVESFLVSLPAAADIEVWTSSFRDALRRLLGDVDLVSVGVNLECNLRNPAGYNPQLALSQSIVAGSEAIDSIQVNGANSDEVHMQRFLDNLKKRQFPFANYHPPSSFIYYYADNAYLGGIVLWRERGKPRVSTSTIQTMEHLSAFMVFLLSDFVARYQLMHPVDHAFLTAIEDIVVGTGLTSQERRILMLQLVGLAYEEIAEKLNISLNTVRTHVRSIYEKTGARGQAELLAKYFTPRLGSK